MSRDWTPRELHYADLGCKQETGKYLHDTTFHWMLNGKEIPSPEYEKEIKEKFPNLSFLLDGFMSMYHENYSTTYGEEVCTAIEDELKSIVDNDIDFKNILYDIHPHDFYGISLSFVKEWYMGDGQYYQGENNRRMFDDIDYAINQYAEIKDLEYEIMSEMSR